MRKFIFCLILGLILTSRLTFAAENLEDETLRFDLSMDYEEITIIASNDKNSIEKAILTMPDGNKKELTRLEDEFIVTIKEPLEGKYELICTQGINSKSKLRVDASTNDDSAKRKINELSVYHNEQTVFVSYNDASVPSVTLEIISDVNNKVLFDETVTGDYLFTVPSQVSSVIVNVTPSTKNSIAGYKESFFLDLKEDLGFMVSFPDETLTKDEIITILVDAKGYFDGELKVNGKESTFKMDKEVEADLSEGLNTISVTVSNDKKNQKTFEKEIILDTVPPELQIEKTFDDEIVHKEDYLIKGYVRSFDNIYLNGENINEYVSMDGYFEYPYKLHLGSNEIVIFAEDEAKNETVYSIHLIYEKRKLDVRYVILFGALVLIILGVLLGKKVLAKLKTNVSKPKNEKKVSLSINFKADKGVIIFLIICFMIVFINLFVIGLFRCVSGSMEPTFAVGDVSLNTKIFKTIERGDFVTFKVNGDTVGKRVIGLENEKVSFKDGYVYINDQKLDEPYLDSDVETNCTKSFIVPEGCVFMLGDNRDISFDSRYWDDPYVKIAQIKSKYLLTVYKAK